jgi:molecular chaperone GrpE
MPTEEEQPVPDSPAETNAAGGADSGASAGPNDAAARLADTEAALREAENRYLRSQAELENFRKRSRRELDDYLRFAALPLISDLLPVLDNLKRALEAASKSGGDAQSLIDGVRMVADQFRGALEKHHCVQIAAAGAVFDPHFHSAIGQVPSPDVPPGHVAHVAVEGYRLHDRVVRPAQVLIAASDGASGGSDRSESHSADAGELPPGGDDKVE